MYEGTNPSALRSRERLRAALVRLLARERLAQVTVKELCAEAGVSRQTFYQIYGSIDEVVAYHFRTLFEAFAAEHGDLSRTTVRGLALHYLEFFRGQEALVAELADNGMVGLLEAQLEEYLPQVGLFSLVNSRERHPEYSVAFIAGALAQVLVRWQERGYDLAPAELAEVVEGLIVGKPVT